MTSKEALEQIATIYGETNSLEGTYDLFLKIKQDLERLEVLETSVLEYKDQEKLYWETAQNNVKLRDENEKLKKNIQNEIELLIERRFNAYACDDYETHNVLNTIIEELKEVMNNENHSE